MPLVIALAGAVRTPGADSASRFMVWLVAVPLVLFLSMPFMGKTAIPHWFNSAWLFAFPLLGYSLSERSEKWLRSWAQASAALTAVCFALFVTYVAVGPIWQTPSAKTSKGDPTQWSYNWKGLKESPAWRGFGLRASCFRRRR